MKFLRRILCLLAVLLVLPIPARAAGNSITVIHSREGETVSGVTFQLYRVAGDPQDAQSAHQSVIQSGQAALATGVTDGEGKILFSGLEDGTYLLMAQPYMVGTKRVEVEMCLLKLPGVDAEGKQTNQLVVKPKSSWTEVPAAVEYRVMKLWDDGNAQGRPVSVSIRLYRNSTLQTTVVLDKNNNWQYSWTEADPTAVWSVIEEVPAKYEAYYQREGNTFTVTNRLQKPGPEPTAPQPDAPEKPKLPQTGQLWWPVPVMGFAGAILFLLGWIRRKESENAA